MIQSRPKLTLGAGLMIQPFCSAYDIIDILIDVIDILTYDITHPLTDEA